MDQQGRQPQYRYVLKSLLGMVMLASRQWFGGTGEIMKGPGCEIAGYCVAAFLLAGSSAAAESSRWSQQSGDQIPSNIDFHISAGVLGLEAREHVFTSSSSSDHLSLLTWQSTSPVVTAGFDADLPDGWKFGVSVTIATSGDGYMEDLDWQVPYSPSFAAADWSDQSLHGNTNLDWYLNGSVKLGRDYVLDENTRINAHAGLKYVDVQWAANDGSYIYSVGGFRDSTGTFGGSAITYRQQLPSVFVGLDAEMVRGDWTFGIGGQAGVTIFARATDRHWMRVPPLRFEDYIAPAPTIAASASASYQIRDGLDLMIAADIEKIFLGRADTNVFNNNTNTLISASANTGGAELLSGRITVGISGSI